MEWVIGERQNIYAAAAAATKDTSSATNEVEGIAEELGELPSSPLSPPPVTSSPAASPSPSPPLPVSSPPDPEPPLSGELEPPSLPSSLVSSPGGKGGRTDE